MEPPFAPTALDALAQHLAAWYRPERAGELLAAARARRPGEPLPVALTFDDDLTSHRDEAAPVLARHGVVATAFLTGSETPFWWQLLQGAIDAGTLEPAVVPGVDAELVGRVKAGELRAVRVLARSIEALPAEERAAVTAALAAVVAEPPAPLDAAGRAALVEQGWEIGFHTRAHAVLTAVPDAELAAAVAGAETALPGVDARSFAYPHGKGGDREARAVREAGFDAAFTGAPGAVTADTDPHLIPRLDLAPGPLGAMALSIAQALSGGARR